MKTKFTIFLFSMILFVSCNSREKEEKQADVLLKKIEQLISENNLNAAKIEIDSLHLLYPRLVKKRKIAASFEDTIVVRENTRTLKYYEQILPKIQQTADSIQKNFKLEKDDSYQQYGNYVYKTQRTENNTDRNYLKAYVDENCDFYLISNYSGTKIEHIAIEVSGNNSFAQTDTILISNPANHSFTDSGIRWETITFKNDAENGVASFISQFANMQLKVTLKGKKTYSYYLATSDKNAISASYHLWIVKKDILKIQKEIKKAALKIERIKNQANKEQN